MMTVSFQKNLERELGRKLKLRINNNRSTMLSVKWEPDYTQVSLHRMFLKAPKNVMDDLACYLKNENQQMASSVKSFIEKNLRHLDYSNRIQSTLNTEGRVYNLRNIYNILNKEYFQNSMNLNISWFGKHHSKSRSRVTFGLYHEPLKLIKIHRVLDHIDVPEYFLSYIVYHEMVHHVCPSFYDLKGIHRMHTPEFKKREKQFKFYSLAQKWITRHRDRFFAFN